MNMVRNIIAVECTQASSAVCVPPFSKFFDESKWQHIAIQVPASLTISDKIEDGVRLYTAKLVYRTCEKPEDIERIVYKCQSADGELYIIGSYCRPYPVTTVVDNHPANFTDSQLYEVTVSYTSSFKILCLHIK